MFGERVTKTVMCVVEYDHNTKQMQITCDDPTLRDIVYSAFTEKRLFIASIGMDRIDRAKEIMARGVDSIGYMHAVSCELWQRSNRLEYIDSEEIPGG
jgi:hypothetical protein